MIIKVIKLGTVCKDKATCLTGTLTHWLINMDQQVTYLFQPKGINPENGQPVGKIRMEQARLEIPEDSYEEIEVPFEIIGSIVTNKASGFSGTAVSFIRHVNGCFHVAIQPRGVLSRTNSPIQQNEFDLRECRGEKIIELTPTEKKRSETTYPSPTGSVLETFNPPPCP